MSGVHVFRTTHEPWGNCFLSNLRTEGMAAEDGPWPSGGPHSGASAPFAALGLTCGACDPIESGTFGIPTRHMFGCPLLETLWNVGHRRRGLRPAWAGRTEGTVTGTSRGASLRRPRELLPEPVTRTSGDPRGGLAVPAPTPQPLTFGASRSVRSACERRRTPSP